MTARSQGRLDESRDILLRALAILEKAEGSEDVGVARTLTELGQTLLALDEPAEAIVHLERALAILATREVDPIWLARTRFVLGRALWSAPSSAGRDRTRARALVEQVRDAWTDTGSYTKGDLAMAEQWLAEHR